MNNRMMTEGAPWKHILRFAMPVLAGSLLQQLYNTVDAIIVGNYAGEASLAAVGTTGTFAFLFLALALGFSAGNGVVVAQHYGAKDEQRVRDNASTGILFLMVLGAASMVVSLLLSGPAFSYVLGVPDSYIDQTLIYFNIFAVGFIFQFGYNAFSAILRAVGDSASTLYFLLIASVINIGLDFLFVAVFHWGVAGAAIATDISQAVSFVAAYLYMRKKYPIFRFALKDYKWNGALIAKTVKIGFPISLQMIIISVGFTFIQRAVNEFGQAMTASFTVGQRLEQYLNLPFNAFSTTLATYVGQNIGAGRMDRVKTGTRQTLIISLLMTAAISAVVWVLADNIIVLFSLSDQAAVYCLEHLHTVALINIILSVYVPIFGLFQGSNHSIVPALVACFALTMRVVVTYVFRYSPFLGYSIIWWNGLFGYGVGCTLTWIYYLSGKWQINSRVTG